MNDDNKKQEEFEGDSSIEPGYVSYTENEDEVYPVQINFSRELFSLFELKRRYTERKTLELAPDYQREGNIWKDRQKSELIESILMGMPLPLVYFFGNEDGIWQVVDGRQRLMTLFDFLDNKFALSKGMNVLKEISGKKFKELTPRQQGALEDYSLNINLIKPPTPDRIKFDIFDRVNRGGTQLNNQEMRNAIYQGKATILLNELAQNEYFLAVTENSISPTRMKDRYIILRFIGFYLLKVFPERLRDTKNRPIEYKSDIDDFLGKIMQFINRADESDIYAIKILFGIAMRRSYSIFGAGCFKVSHYLENYGRNLPLNMALFESLAYLCSVFNIERDNAKISSLKTAVYNLFGQQEFINSIRMMPVDSSIKVMQRFTYMDKIIGELFHA